MKIHSVVYLCLGAEVPLSSSFAQAAPLMESMLLGVLAQRVGQAIVWDEQAMRAEGLPQLDKYITPTYYNGYNFPGVSL